jgi:hypothetical protein
MHESRSDPKNCTMPTLDDKARSRVVMLNLCGGDGARRLGVGRIELCGQLM